MDPNTNEFSLLELLSKLKNEYKQTGKNIQLNLVNMNDFVVTGLTDTIGNKYGIELAFRDIFEKAFRYIPDDEDQLIVVSFDFQKNLKGYPGEYDLCVYVMVKNTNDFYSIDIFKPSTVEFLCNRILYSEESLDDSQYYLILLPFNYRIQWRSRREYIHDENYLNDLRAKSHKC